MWECWDVQVSEPSRISCLDGLGKLGSLDLATGMSGCGGWRCLAYSMIVDPTDETKDERRRKTSPPNLNRQSRHDLSLGLFAFEQFAGC